MHVFPDAADVRGKRYAFSLLLSAQAAPSNDIVKGQGAFI